MTISLDSSQYHLVSKRMRTQIGVTGLAFIIRALDMADLNPLAAGLSIQSVARIVQLIEKKFPETPSQIVQHITSEIIFFATYTLASQLDPRLQALSFLALSLLDAKKLGTQNLWNELKKS